MGIIIKPILTEKTSNLSSKLSRYAFRVSPSANKIEIKNAIEELYNVKVIDVNTSQFKGKNKSRYTKAGVINGKTATYKKAFVTVKEGDVIDFYSNDI